MPTDCITFRETGYFSKLICDYIDQDPMLEPFYNRFPSLGNLKAQMVEKQSTYAKETRAILTDSLHNQYKKCCYFWKLPKPIYRPCRNPIPLLLLLDIN